MTPCPAQQSTSGQLSACVTVVSRNYLHFARALALSLGDSHPDLPLFVCLADRPPSSWQAQDDSDLTILFADQLDIPAWQRFAFQYNACELCCALKPFAIEQVLKRGFDKVLYLDSDIQVYDSLSPLLERLNESNLLLTPQLVMPSSDDGMQGDELETLYSGSFNLGFLGIRATAEAQRFLSWWQGKMRRQCIIDNAAHCFLDQSWASFAPCLFDGVGIERGPQYNVMHHDLFHRSIDRHADGSLRVRDQPLAFFHFTGFDARRPELLTRHRGGLRADSFGPPVVELVESYAHRLAACGARECQAWGYGYAELSDNTPIDPCWREAVRCNHPLVSTLEDPFVEIKDILEQLDTVRHELQRSRVDWQHKENRRRVRELERFLAGVLRSRGLGHLLRLRDWYRALRYGDTASSTQAMLDPTAKR